MQEVEQLLAALAEANTKLSRAQSALLAKEKEILQARRERESDRYLSPLFLFPLSPLLSCNGVRMRYEMTSPSRRQPNASTGISMSGKLETLLKLWQSKCKRNIIFSSVLFYSIDCLLHFQFDLTLSPSSLLSSFSSLFSLLSSLLSSLSSLPSFPNDSWGSPIRPRHFSRGESIHSRSPTRQRKSNSRNDEKVSDVT